MVLDCGCENYIYFVQSKERTKTQSRWEQGMTPLYRLDLEVKGDEREDQGLCRAQRSQQRISREECDGPSNPAQGSRIHADPRGLHCPEYPQASRSSQSKGMRQREPNIQHMCRLASKAIWSLPTRISSSCLPTMFFFGQLVSSSLRCSAEDEAWSTHTRD